MLIEAAVESLDAALAAVEGGAHRIELCTDLAHGGITPDLNLLHVQLPIPVFVLVRPRAGDFVYTDAEHHTMLEQISRAKSAGAHGIVTGDLSLDRTRDLIADTGGADNLMYFAPRQTLLTPGQRFVLLRNPTLGD